MIELCIVMFMIEMCDWMFDGVWMLNVMGWMLESGNVFGVVSIVLVVMFECLFVLLVVDGDMLYVNMVVIGFNYGLVFCWVCIVWVVVVEDVVLVDVVVLVLCGDVWVLFVYLLYLVLMDSGFYLLFVLLVV